MVLVTGLAGLALASTSALRRPGLEKLESRLEPSLAGPCRIPDRGGGRDGVSKAIGGEALG